MRTAISLPDEVFADAEKLASRLKISRSELYARALKDYVRQHAPDAVTEAYNRVCSAVDNQPDEFNRRAARATLKRGEFADRNLSLVGLFSDEPDLADAVCGFAYESRGSARMRDPG